MAVFEAGKMYAARGWVPIPLGGKKPLNVGWLKTTVGDWQQRWSPEATNIGILTGAPSGIVVLDIDIKDGGVDYWDKISRNYPAIHTVVVRTGSGGLHYYFAAGAISMANSIGIVVDGVKIGIDVRGTNGQVVAPPSINGNPYTFIIHPDEIKTLPEMPEWVMQMLNTRVIPKHKTVTRVGRPMPRNRSAAKIVTVRDENGDICEPAD